MDERIGGDVSLMECSVVRVLKGHSGCSVSLCAANGRYFVRKLSASLQYNKRLRQQIDKQIRLMDVIRVPHVLAQGHVDELLYFDMEFIAGQDFQSYALVRNLNDLSGLAERVMAAAKMLAATQQGVLDAGLFQAKLIDMGAQIRASPFYPEQQPFLERMIAVLERADWSTIPRTQCHGDLTMENMLLMNDGSIAFIDTLDGPLESVWLDIAKLRQDLLSGWSLRSILWREETNRNGRLLHMFSRYLLDEIEREIKTSFPTLIPHLTALQTLQAARVLPYVQDASTFNNVIHGLDQVLRGAQ